MSSKVNYLITRATISEQKKCSLLKMREHRIGGSVCITHHVSGGFIFIMDCPRELRQRLLTEQGGVVVTAAWGSRDCKVNIYDVIRIVGEWVKEQN